MYLRLLFFSCLFFITTAASAQMQADAKVVLLFKDTLIITLHVQLNAVNDELVLATQPGEDGKPQDLKINTAVVSSFFFNGYWYKFKDLKNGYKSSDILRNCCVHLIIGTDSLGLFEFKDDKNISAYYIQTPKDGSLIYNIEHPYVAGDLKSFSLLRFIKCKFLEEKISAKSAGYFYDEETAKPDKIKVWKNIITAYYYYCSK